MNGPAPESIKSPGIPLINITELDDARFQLELEFVLSLANPWYVHFLAQQNVLNEPEFINFLDYLLIWKTDPYIQYINYPSALFFLDLLQSPDFREAIKLQENAMAIHSKQYYSWLVGQRPTLGLMAIEEPETNTPEEQELNPTSPALY